jgi:small subunit ribosomal protein S16
VISIHLRRTGAKKDPHYRVVVADSRDARDGSFIEVLGHYHPRFTPARVTLDLEKIKSWISRGAQPSDTVKSLVRQVESGKLDALPDLPKLEPMPLPAIEVEDEATGAMTDEGTPEPAEVEAGTAAEELSEAQTADIPVPEVSTPDADGEAGEKEPEKATE